MAEISPFNKTNITAGVKTLQNQIGKQAIIFKDNNIDNNIPFKITIDTTKGGSAPDTFIFPLINQATNFTINWGDGNSDLITSYNQSELTHVYDTSGIYQISCTDEIYGTYFNGGGDKLKVISLDQFGTHKFSQGTGIFSGCSNMVANYTDTPILVDQTVDCLNLFRNCASFNPDLQSFDVTIGTHLLLGGGMSNSNYDLFLIGLDGFGRSNGVMSVGVTKYTAIGSTARANLISRGWTLTDGGLA